MVFGFRSMTSNHLPIPSVASSHPSVFGFFMRESYWAVLQNVGGSAQAPACASYNVQRGTWGLPSPVKLECHHMIYRPTVLNPIKNTKRITNHVNASEVFLNH
jgi:hypothetical protein